MSVKTFIINWFSKKVRKEITRTSRSAIHDQFRILQSLIQKAGNTQFGKDHQFNKVKTHNDFCTKVPIRNYEELKPYVNQIISGETDILWPGKPKYFAKTSGTTSGVKYIPITKESISYHIKTARNSILNYIAQTGNNVFSGNMIFLSGSPALTKTGPIPTGRLSGIVNHEIPAWVKPNQLPDYQTNCIEAWETKLDAIVQQTCNQPMTLISGIPPWVQMYYERLLIKSGKDTIKDMFPHFKLFIHGGVNYLPYKNSLEKLAGKGVDTLETYPASEGFIAFQDTVHDEGLLLNTNAGMFFEFIPLDQIGQTNPARLLLNEVELDKDYVLIISSNAGLWAYNIGDTVRFSSLDPYRIRVSGRVSHFISAFGEHVIAKEVEQAMDMIAKKYQFNVVEFTVAPNISPQSDTQPHHQWLVEFEKHPIHLDEIELALDQEMCRQNIYYRDLIDGGILSTLRIVPLPRNAFINYMKSKGKLGGQNKVPRLQNDRDLAESLLRF